MFMEGKGEPMMNGKVIQPPCLVEAEEDLGFSASSIASAAQVLGQKKLVQCLVLA